MAKRPEELRQIGLLAEFLSNEYPESFKLDTYTHPINGECKILIIKSNEKYIHFDYDRISGVKINYDNNSVVVHTINPVNMTVVSPLFKDPTVM